MVQQVLSLKGWQSQPLHLLLPSLLVTAAAGTREHEAKKLAEGKF